MGGTPAPNAEIELKTNPLRQNLNGERARQGRAHEVSRALSHPSKSLTKRKSVVKHGKHPIRKRTVACLIRNWLLIALSLFAVVGIFIAILYYFWPCTSHLIPREQKVVDKLEIKESVVLFVCKPTINGVVHEKPAQCRGNATLVNETTCQEPTCLDESGNRVTGLTKCAKACSNDQCLGYAFDDRTQEKLHCNKLLTQCTQTRRQECLTSMKCKEADGAPAPMPACDALTVQYCVHPFTNATTTKPANASCPKVSICKFCYDKLTPSIRSKPPCQVWQNENVTLPSDGEGCPRFNQTISYCIHPITNVSIVKQPNVSCPTISVCSVCVAKDDPRNITKPPCDPAWQLENKTVQPTGGSCPLVKETAEYCVHPLTNVSTVKNGSCPNVPVCEVCVNNADPTIRRPPPCNDGELLNRTVQPANGVCPSVRQQSDFDGLLLIDFSASLRIYDNCSCVDYWQYTESGTVHYKFGCDTTSNAQDPWCKIDQSKCSAVIENVGTSAPDEWEKPLDENSKKYAPWRYCDGKRGVALGTGSLATPSAQVLKFASPLSVAILPGMTITISGSPCASSGVKTSAIGAAVGDTNLTLDANVTLAIPGDACTIAYSLKGKAVHGANHWTTEVDLATEVIITQFHKKLVMPGSRAAFQMGATGWSDELVDYEHLNWGNYKAIVSPVQPAQLTPCVTSADISEPSKCAGRTPLNTSVAAWRRATPISITYFAPPLSWCATQLAARGSNRTNKFQACILLTDGKNDDTNLTLSQDDYVQAFCSTFASELGGLPCTAGNIAFTMKEALNVTIIGVYMDVNQMSTENNAINLFCYSSCNNDTIARCKAQTDYKMTRSCPYMLDGNATAIDELTKKIDGLVDEIFEQVSTANDVPAQPVTSSVDTVVVSDSVIPESVTGASQSVSTSETVGTTFVTSSIKTTVISETSVGQTKELSSKFNQTETISKAESVEEGCNDPSYFFLLFFIVPLFAYLLYYPCKRRHDRRKDHMRALLKARDALIKQAERANERNRTVYKSMSAQKMKAAINNAKETPRPPLPTKQSMANMTAALEKAKRDAQLDAAAAAMAKRKEEEERLAAEAEDPDFETFYTEEGIPYYRHRLTGDVTWEKVAPKKRTRTVTKSKVVQKEVWVQKPKQKQYKWEVKNTHYLWSSHTHGGIMKVDYGNVPKKAQTSKQGSGETKKIVVEETVIEHVEEEISDDEELQDVRALQATYRRVVGRPAGGDYARDPRWLEQQIAYARARADEPEPEVIFDVESGMIVDEGEVEAVLHEIECADTEEKRNKLEHELHIAIALEEKGMLKEDGLFWLQCCKPCSDSLDTPPADSITEDDSDNEDAAPVANHHTIMESTKALPKVGRKHAVKKGSRRQGVDKSTPNSSSSPLVKGAGQPEEFYKYITPEGHVYYHSRSRNKTEWELPPNGIVVSEEDEYDTLYTDDGIPYYLNKSTGETVWNKGESKFNYAAGGFI